MSGSFEATSGVFDHRRRADTVSLRDRGRRGSAVLRRCAATVLLTCAALAGGASAAHAAYDPADPDQRAAYDQALAIGAQAYDYGVALLSMDRLFRGSTSVNVPDGRGAGPVNRFSTFRKLADAEDRHVVAPNSDTLYSAAWLDLSHGPVVLHLAPSPRRYRDPRAALALRGELREHRVADEGPEGHRLPRHAARLEGPRAEGDSAASARPTTGRGSWAGRTSRARAISPAPGGWRGRSS